MSDKIKIEIHIALIHYPVYNKVGEVITSSVTTLDIHDISRIARTYSVSSFCVVTPLKTQRQLVGRLIEHWMTGYGAEYNPTRKEALLVTRVMNSLTETVLDLTEKYGKRPTIVATCAKKISHKCWFSGLTGRNKKWGAHSFGIWNWLGA